MQNILTPQASQFLAESIIEILKDYHVSDEVADKISVLISNKFNNKIVSFFATNARINEMLIMKEAIEQCKGQSN